MGPRRSKIRQTFDRDLGAALNSLQTSCHVGDLFQKPSGIGNVLGICVFQCITSALSAKMMESLMDRPAEPLQPDTMLGCHTGGCHTGCCHTGVLSYRWWIYPKDHYTFEHEGTTCNGPSDEKK